MADSTRYLDVKVTSDSMPLLAKLKNSSVIFRDTTSGGGVPSYANLTPAVYYAHNVLPTSQGLLATKPLVFGNSNANADADSSIDHSDAIDVFVFNLFDSNLSKALLVIKVYRDEDNYLRTKSYTYNPDAPNFTFQVACPELDVLSTNYADGEVMATVSDVEGVTVVSLSISFTDNVGQRRRSTKLFKTVNNKVAPTAFSDITASLGIVMNNTEVPNLETPVKQVVKGFIGAFNYLIGYSDSQVIWSSPIDSYDFTPSLATGAGSGTPSGVHGTIVTAVATNAGFNLFYNSGVISARLSNNPNFPWNFTPIGLSKGIDNWKEVTSSFPQYAVTSAGLAAFEAAASEVVAPTIADWLAAGVYEDMIEGVIHGRVLTEPLATSIEYISERYICISYKPRDADYFDYFLVYDVLLNSFGKIKYPHKKVFQLNVDTLGEFLNYDYFTEANQFSYDQLGETSYLMIRDNSTKKAPTIKYTIGIVGVGGELAVVDPSLNADSAEGVAVLGRFSLKEGLATTLDYITLEEVPEESHFELTVLTSYSGRQVDATYKPFEAVSVAGLKKFNTRATGVNHSVMIEGAFNLTKMSVALRSGGYR